MVGMKPFLCLLALVLAGCEGPSPTRDNTAPYGQVVAQTDWGWVRVVKIDGHDYVVVSSQHGVAICPKTP